VTAARVPRRRRRAWRTTPRLSQLALSCAGVRVHDLLYRDGEDRSDGSEAEREAAAKLEKALLRADVTGDGRLSREELREALLHAFMPQPLSGEDIDTEEEFWALFPMGLPVFSLTGSSGALAKVGAFLAESDKNGNGHLDKDEFRHSLQEAVSPAPLKDLAQSEKRMWKLFPMGLPVQALLGVDDPDAAELADALARYDINGNGFLDKGEFRTALISEIKMRQRVQHMKKIIIGLSVVIVVLVALITGTTFAVVDAAKDTEATGGTLTDRASGEALRVGSDGFGVQADGTLRLGNNQADGAARALQVGRTRVPGAVNSSLSNEAYADLVGIGVQAESGEYVELDVQGFARIGEEHVVLVTGAGFVTLDGSDIFFEDNVGELFHRAGFDIAPAPPPAPPPNADALANIEAAREELLGEGGDDGGRRRLMSSVGLTGHYNRGDKA